MRILVIGGTRFVGRHITESALSRGHEVTLFHRGQTGKGLFDVEEILGNRDGETHLLAGRTWDAVIDTCGYFPRIVDQTVAALRNAVGCYCFISSISVYALDAVPPISEDGPVSRFQEEPTSEEITGDSYGPFKVLCEESVQRGFGDEKTIVIRPGLVAGPYDPTDRFTYWVARFAGEGPVLVPDRAQQPCQFIDGRDLAEFTVRAVEGRSAGIYNAVGPAHPTVLGELWSSCKMNAGGLATEVVVGNEFLEEREVKPWEDLPLVLPVEFENLICDNTKAIDRGLTIRPMAETIRDTAEWYKNRAEAALKTGLSPERESVLLREWQEQSANSL